MPDLIINAQSCNHCGLCATTCPWGLLEVVKDGIPQLIKAAEKSCILCGHCEAVCPSGALQLHDPQLIPIGFLPQTAEIDSARLSAYLLSRRSIRNFRKEQVDRVNLEQFMNVVRYAPSGRNRQDVHWLMIHDTGEVRRLTGMVIDWMRETVESGNPLAARYNLSGMITAWEEGRDHICHTAPHLVIANVNEENPVALTNAVIALSHLDIAAPSFGIGTCWGGIFMQAIKNWEPLRMALDLPSGHTAVHCLMFGYPAISYQRPPKRNHANVVWR